MIKKIMLFIMVFFGAFAVANAQAPGWTVCYDAAAKFYYYCPAATAPVLVPAERTITQTSMRSTQMVQQSATITRSSTRTCTSYELLDEATGGCIPKVAQRVIVNQQPTRRCDYGYLLDEDTGQCVPKQAAQPVVYYQQPQQQVVYQDQPYYDQRQRDSNWNIDGGFGRTWNSGYAPWATFSYGRTSSRYRQRGQYQQQYRQRYRQPYYGQQYMIRPADPYGSRYPQRRFRRY